MPWLLAVGALATFLFVPAGTLAADRWPHPGSDVHPATVGQPPVRGTGHLARRQRPELDRRHRRDRRRLGPPVVHQQPARRVGHHLPGQRRLPAQHRHPARQPPQPGLRRPGHDDPDDRFGWLRPVQPVRPELVNAVDREGDDRPVGLVVDERLEGRGPRRSPQPVASIELGTLTTREVAGAANGRLPDGGGVNVGAGVGANDPAAEASGGHEQEGRPRDRWPRRRLRRSPRHRRATARSRHRPPRASSTSRAGSTPPARPTWARGVDGLVHRPGAR